ncbi:hypothetical protein BX070DRAFT_83178 [Coemansia spiralis]|nr:hypothetical protein BX070DRAFT_83178 [Coemansia spiralis]
MQYVQLTFFTYSTSSRMFQSICIKYLFNGCLPFSAIAQALFIYLQQRDGWIFLTSSVLFYLHNLHTRLFLFIILIGPIAAVIVIYISERISYKTGARAEKTAVAAINLPYLLSIIDEGHTGLGYIDLIGTCLLM